ncbi:MAG: AtpZ/AtpI family protein [Lachnospiraceae bacterium]|nr:AtpZ/AtpI family protein [Lachnospiraceae bacterium]
MKKLDKIHEKNRFLVDIFGKVHYNKIHTAVIFGFAAGYRWEAGNLKRKRSYDRSVFQSLSLISQFGINMLVPIGLMTWLGIWMDEHFETSFWVILLFFVGALAGGRNVYRMAKKVYGQKEKRENNDRKVEKRS